MPETGMPLDWKPGPQQILVQAHCHQRSLVGTGLDAEALAIVYPEPR